MRAYGLTFNKIYILNIEFLYFSLKHVYVNKTQNKRVKKKIIQVLPKSN